MNFLQATPAARRMKKNRYQRGFKSWWKRIQAEARVSVSRSSGSMRFRPFFAGACVLLQVEI
jgi:hypothetical protein